MQNAGERLEQIIVEHREHLGTVTALAFLAVDLDRPEPYHLCP
jgi:hypothetical protein